MSRKFSDFFFSFGLIVIGVALLGFASLTTGRVPEAPRVVVANWPVASARAAENGGDITPEQLPPSRPRVPLPKDQQEFSGGLTAAAAVAIDGETNTVIFKKNYQEPRPLASITKLMSALVLTSLPVDWTTTTVITEDDADTSSHHIQVGERFTLEDLWHIALIGSSNSAIHALVRGSGISETEFVARMNEKAVALRMPSLRFVEPTGLNSGNIGSAIDVERLLREALKVERIYTTLNTPEYYADPLGQDKKRRVWTTNWLLTNWAPNTFNKDTIAGKTGYITSAGYNFAVQLVGRKNHVIRVVVLGAASNEARFSEARDIAEWIFDNYVWPGEAGYEKLVE